MPIYEYICKTCGKKSEYYLKNRNENVSCSCGSSQLERALSSFAVTEGSGSSPAGGCADGSCGFQSPCSSGMCGL